MLTRLDADASRRWSALAAEQIAAHRDELDDLNVFPVPDGDTGSNLAATLRAAADAVAAADAGLSSGAVMQVMARAAVLSARGNSGVIVSQVLRGLADGVAESGELDGADGVLLAAALRGASDAAYAAVADPVEGTLLSVLRAAADAAMAQCAGADCSLIAVVRAANDAAVTALNRTPEQLPVLAAAGVVDAGGRGVVVLLDALEMVVSGGLSRLAPILSAAGGKRARSMVREMGSSEFDYEVQYLLTGTDADVEEVRAELQRLGDSVAIAGTGDGVFSVHVHVNDAGAAIEVGLQHGLVSQLSVVRFADSDGTRTAIVAVVDGVGLARLFRAEGIAVVEVGAAQIGSPAEVFDAIVGVGAGRVIVLPNSHDNTTVAHRAAQMARDKGITVSVIPTKSAVQGLAAVAIHDPNRRFDENVIALAEAAAATRFAQVTIADEDSITYAGPCRAGDVLGHIDGEVVEVGSDVTTVGLNLVRRLIAVGAELVTVLVGTDMAAAAAAESVVRYVRKNHPLVEITDFDGGQDYPLLIGIE